MSLLCVVEATLRVEFTLEFMSCFAAAVQAIRSSRGIKRGVGRGGVLYLKPYTNHTTDDKHLDAPNTVYFFFITFTTCAFVETNIF